MAENTAILVINAGSSSIKFSVFETGDNLTLLYSGLIDNVINAPVFSAKDQNGATIETLNSKLRGHAPMLDFLLSWLGTRLTHHKITAVGHRVVHGGTYFTTPVMITEETLALLESLIPLAPLHQPHNVAAIKAIKLVHPDLPQIACFDTAFHATQPKLARSFALPRKYTDEGIIRYGFHGLSYEYITSVLPEHVGNKARGRVIIAHLGNGASMCAVKNGKSIATTMGFTALDGLMMGTRTGAIDPGILLYFLEQQNFSNEQLNTLLYKESGLLGVSGISHDMRELEQSDAPEAKEAVALFCYRAAREIGSLAAALGGLDVLVFTAGIGEKSALIRQTICQYSSWLGIEIDAGKNAKHQTRFSAGDSEVEAIVIPTNEELMIARHSVAGVKGEQ